MKIRFFSILPVFFILLAQPVMAAPAAITQRNWMVQLVEALGWSFGLPDQPADADYQRILEGRRHYRIEAEEYYHPDDHVSVQQFESFGAFSGKGWLSGVSSPTSAHLHFNLPLGGEFAATVALRLPGHKIRIGEKTIEIDGGDRFSVHSLGTFTLAAGAQEIEIHVPPNSAIDYLEFTAPDLPPVQPVAGWQPDEPLTLATMAETVAQLLTLNPLLAAAGPPVSIEGETIAELPGQATVTQVRHLGEPSGDSWVRAGAIPATLRLRFHRAQPGVYALQMRAVAEAPIIVTVNENLSLPIPAKPYLETLPIGSFILPAGENMVDIQVPPRGGLDALLIIPGAGREEFLRLAGLAGKTDPPETVLVEKYLALLAALGGSR